MLRWRRSALRHRNQHVLFSVDQRRSVVAGEFETVAMRNGVCWTGLDTIAAEDTTVVIDVVNLRVPLAAAKAFPVGILGPFNVDTTGRTSSCAEKTSYTLFQAVLIALENMGTAKTFGELGGPVRVLFGNCGL